MAPAIVQVHGVMLYAFIYIIIYQVLYKQMDTLPIELINKIKLYNSHKTADMIREKRKQYSLDDKCSDEEFFEDNLWGHIVLQFENEFGILMVGDILTLM